MTEIRQQRTVRAIPFLREIEAAFANLSKFKWMVGGLGVLSVLIHFWRIRFLPQLTISDLGLIAAAIVLFSGFAGIVLLCAFFIPGLSLQAWSQQRLLPRPPISRGRFTPSGAAHAGTGKHDLAKRARAANVPSRAARLYRKAFVLALLCTYLGFGLAWGAYFLLSHLEGNAFEYGVVALYLLALAVFSAGLAAGVPRTSVNLMNRRRLKWQKYTALATSMYLLSLPLTSIPSGLLHTLNRASSAGAALPLLILPFVHVLVYATHRTAREIRATVIGLFAALMIIWSGLIFDSNDMGAAHFRLGMLKNQSVIVDTEGCKLVRAARIAGVSCDLSSQHAEGLYVIENVFLLTRIGSHVLISASDWSTAARKPSLPIPTKNTISWFDSASSGAREAESTRVPQIGMAEGSNSSL